jgi:hypothetical protein
MSGVGFDQAGSMVDASPDLYPLRLDLAADRVGLIRLDETAYREASFLDERLLPGGAGEISAPWSEVGFRALSLRGESDFIFHMGHVGSTLLSRLLGDHERIFALREPAVLRSLATDGMASAADFATPLTGVLKLLARVYRPDQRSLIKATSFVSDLGPSILQLVPSAKAILLFASPQVYISTILSGPASRAGLASAARQRLARLGRRFGNSPRDAASLSEGELAALGWLCEVAALTDIAIRFPDRVLWLDFDDFLAKPAAGLFAVLRRLNADPTRSAVDAMLVAPHWRRYSKAPEHPYGVELRREILSRGRDRHKAEIERGLNWINSFAGAHRQMVDAIRVIAASPKLA